MMVLESFYRFVLFFYHYYFWVPFLLIGMSYIDRKAFNRTCLVVFVSAFLNVYLKYLWQIPLDPSLGKEGWAFPSGHAQFNFVLWASLAWHLRRGWVYFCGCLINVLGWFAMVYFKYHTWDDIFAAIFFGFLIIMAMAAWYRHSQTRDFEFGLVGVLCLIILHLLIPESEHKDWLWVYCGFHIAAILHAFVYQKQIINLDQSLGLRYKVFEIILILGLNGLYSAYVFWHMYQSIWALTIASIVIESLCFWGIRAAFLRCLR